MGKTKTPALPDPRETAAAQTGTNVSTALANAILGNVNQITPFGTLTYDQIGTQSVYDPYTRQNYDIPRYQATQELTPEQQEILGRTTAAQTNLAGLAQQLSGQAQTQLADPLTLGNEAVEGRLFELGSARLDPRFERQRAQLEQDLANRGIRIGSAAYQTATEQQRQAEADAYNQLLLSGRGQAVQEQLAQRAQPINEISALLSGSQVTQPSFVPTQQPQLPTTDVAGLINQNYQSQLANYQQQAAQRQSLLGGLFGLGANIIASDKRVKENIKRVGKLDDGTPVYSYNYKTGGPTHIGVMAQDVEKSKPGSVVEVGGIKHVDYNKAVV